MVIVFVLYFFKCMFIYFRFQFRYVFGFINFYFKIFFINFIFNFFFFINRFLVIFFFKFFTINVGKNISCFNLFLNFYKSKSVLEFFFLHLILQAVKLFYNFYYLTYRKVLYLRVNFFNNGGKNFFTYNSILVFWYAGLDTVYVSSLFFLPALLKKNKKYLNSSYLEFYSKKYSFFLMFRFLIISRIFNYFFSRLFFFFLKLTFGFFIKKVNFFSSKMVSKSQNVSLRFFFNKLFSEEYSLNGFSNSKFIDDVVDFSISYYYEFFNRSVYNYHSDFDFLIKPSELNSFVLGRTYSIRADRDLNFSSD